MEITIEFVNGEPIRQEVDDQAFIDALLEFKKNVVSVADTRGGKLYDAWATDGYEEFLCKLAQDAGATLPDEVVNDFRPHASFNITENPLSWGGAWIIFRLDYGKHESDEEFDWIVTRYRERAYRIMEINAPFSIITESGAIAVKTENHQFVFEWTNECWPDVLLDEGRAIAIGWINRILNPHNESSPVGSLVRCPHPYKMIGNQIKTGLAFICEALVQGNVSIRS